MKRHRRSEPDVSEEDVLTEEEVPLPPGESEILDEMRRTVDKLERDKASLGDLKILSRALKELRYAFKVFTKYRRQRKVTVFGSARTPPDDPSYQHSAEFGKRMAEEGWMVLTGAGGGIMEGAHVGAGAEKSMGVNIMLPFEQESNYIISGDPKLVHLKYFFTRKLLFVKEVHGIVLYPGGFGTQDEAFETLTLVQTGKRDLMPIVCVAEPGNDYWTAWLNYITDHLLSRELISPEDLSLFTVTDSVEEAVEEVLGFYSVYNSMRYIKGELILRLHVEPDDALVERLNDEFAGLLVHGRIEKTTAHPFEKSEAHLWDLPRLKLQFNRKAIGRLREMVDLLNDELGQTQ